LLVGEMICEKLKKAHGLELAAVWAA
jgi:hypothetical protein